MEKNSIHPRIAWSAVVILLFLRIPYSVVLIYASANNTGWGPTVFQFGTYLLTAFLIWWEREDLPAVHIDTLALVLILFFKPVQTLILSYWGIDTPLAFPQPVGLLVWAVALALVIALWRSGYKPAPVGLGALGWLAGGLLAGLMLSALQNIGVFQANAAAHGQDLVSFSSLTASTGIAFFYQLGFASASEEPLFRGFLWGYLRRLGWREVWVWLAQAVLFMSAHLYFINALGFQFWVAVPAAALIFGLFAWRSRSVAPGMLAHAAYNAGAYVVLLGLLDSFFRSA